MAAGCQGPRSYATAHCDSTDLEVQLKEHRANYRRAMVITDGVFSMDGDVAPLDKIYAVSQQYDARLMVDDAHGEGVLGKGGRGIVDHFNLHGLVDVEIGPSRKLLVSSEAWLRAIPRSLNGSTNAAGLSCSHLR